MTHGLTAPDAIREVQMTGSTLFLTLMRTDDSLRTLAFYLNAISTNVSVSAAGMTAAASLILFLPNLIIFIFMQSQVMNTMSHSGIK